MDQLPAGISTFRTEIAPESGFLSWCLQQIAAPLPLLFWLPVISVLEQFVTPWIWQSMSNSVDLVLIAVPAWILSFLLAIAVQRMFPGAALVGRRIWVLPVLVLA